jgi:hypothetical protein
MATLTERQQRILNELGQYVPGLRKGQLSADEQIKLGDIIEGIGVGPYVPAVDGDWVDPNPTTVTEALDRIAAAVGPVA